MSKGNQPLFDNTLRAFNVQRLIMDPNQEIKGWRVTILPLTKQD